MSAPIRLNDRELATVLAALRYWAREGLLSDASAEHDISTDGGTLEPLGGDEIRDLADRLNGGGK
jgi:hypothetical protein